MLFTLAIALNGLFLALGAWASLRHFARTEREPRGASLLTAATVLGTALNVWLALRHPDPTPLEIAVSIALMLVALAVFAAAIRATRLGGLSLAFSDATPGAVVETGIYGVIRHPFYTSYILYWLNWLPLSAFDPLSCGVAVAMIAAYTAAARKEERLLTSRLGSPYAGLMQRTWRFLPGVH
ncbi:MAG: isoprenylcysteine carboxylmethyltransferase family protein [Hyphomicrobium sp.]|jgi:protein-S-isoprenylcysteine O-methyltransferase Ste14|uniref:methyltransferase family protein n=1 Tax=Hyphomicrobium sp. TaxID=82 RepID=UPI0025C46A6D|nr:isoprenylcysteine carboxylmethyltransferase family protein [Hyphomicrobium sp.]MBX9863445.1 isoprenylcysteine carboxylmethyltransferase family protein [Hyphomicrobium sp.]